MIGKEKLNKLYTKASVDLGYC